jgi:hypothetical protein
MQFVLVGRKRVGANTSHQTKSNEAFFSGYAEGIRFTEKEQLSV